MEFTIHKDFTDFDGGEWNGLLAEGVSNTPFLLHEYQRNWWEHRGGGEWMQAEAVIAAARRDGRLIGAAPLFQAKHEGEPALLLMGSIEISDYLDVIVRPAELTGFLSGLLDFLHAQRRPEWRALDWYNMPQESPTLAALRVEAEKRGWAYSQQAHLPTPYIRLGGNFEAYLAGLEKKQRHEIRRKVRRLEESGHRLRWYVSDRADLDAEIEALFRLMETDAGKAAFLTPAMRAQMRGTLQAASAGGWLWLAFLEIDDQKAAAALNFDYGGRLWGYNSGVNPDFQSWSPGWVLLSHSLRWASENGRSEVDFMRGGEDYKYRFGAVNRQVVRVRVIRG